MILGGEHMTNKFRAIIDNFIVWGESCNKLYAAFIVGSQARDDHQADEYSDLDIIMIVDDPAYFISSEQWLKSIGNFHVSFIESTNDGERERRVLFDDALDVDFVILPRNIIDTLENESLTILERGYRILVDKIGLQNIMLQSVITARQSFDLPIEENFTNTVNDFWYHSVWTAKKLKRGELWTAKLCIDSYMKWKLLEIIECHSHAIHGLDYDTWHSGRFIEEWAESWVVEKLSQCFSHYNNEDVKISLLSTMDLFRLVALEVAEKLNFQYPSEADEYTTAWVIEAL